MPCAFGTGLYSLTLTEPADSAKARNVCLSPSGDDPSRKTTGTPRRRQSVPRPAFSGAMLTLLRLPF